MCGHGESVKMRLDLIVLDGADVGSMRKICGSTSGWIGPG